MTTGLRFDPSGGKEQVHSVHNVLLSTAIEKESLPAVKSTKFEHGLQLRNS
jgi:hypothetical protein